MTWYGSDGPFPGGGVHTITADEWNSQRLPYFHDDVIQVSIDNTASITSVWSGEIPAGALGLKGSCRLRLSGYYLNNTGSNQTLTLHITFGGVTYYQDTTGSIATAGTFRPWMLDLFLANRGDAVNQWLSGRFTLGGTGTVTTGFGDMSTVTQAADVVFGGLPTQDTTDAQTLGVSFQHGAANASLELFRFSQLFELFPALTASP